MKKFLISALVATIVPLSSFATDYTFSQTQTGVFSTTTGIAHGQAVTWGLSGTTGAANYSGLWSEINGGGKVVTSATLTLTNIYDWQGEGTPTNPLDMADSLFINILSGLNTGTSAKTFINNPSTVDADWSNAINPFVDVAGTGPLDYNDILQTSTTSYPGVLNFNDATTNSLLKAGSTKAGTPSWVTWSDPDGPATKSTLVITFTGANLAVLNALIDADMATGTPTVGLGFAAECHYYMDSVSFAITTGNAPSVPDSGNTLALMGLAMAALVGVRRFKK